MFNVYILQSVKDGRTYVGYARDVLIRFAEHNAGRVKATKHRRPLKVFFSEECKTLADAKYREKYWKSGAGRRKLRTFFIKEFPVPASPNETGRGEARPLTMSEAANPSGRANLKRNSAGRVVAYD
ncbi:MAG: GIY-YIG nuclease family protein [bacterium]|nr:GIY-YIG nuclease family protein [bacterium]